MNRILADVVAFGKQYLRSKIGVFFVFVFPILLILLFGAIFQTAGTTTINLPTQDLDNTPLSRTFLDIMNSTGVVAISMIPGTEDLQAYISANSLRSALLVPSGFQEDALAGTRVNVTLYGDPSQSTVGVVQGVLSAVIVQLNYELQGAQAIVGMDFETVASPEFGYMDFFLPGIIGMTIMTNAMFSLAAICAEYRSRRYFKLLGTTTLTKGEWLASKFIVYFILLMASLLATVAVGALVWGVNATIGLGTLAFVASGVVLFASLGMLFGSAVKDPESASALANAVGFPMMFLSGTFWPLEGMPAYLRAIAAVLPLTYLNNGLRDAMVYANLEGILVNLAVVSAVGVGFFVLAAKLVSWKAR